MASRVLSVEINQRVTKICEIDSKTANPRIHKSFEVKTPEGLITDGMLKPDGGYIGALRQAISANKVKTKKVVFSIISTKIATREVTIPFVKDNRIAGVIAAKAEEYFPVDLSDYRIAYSLLGIMTDEKENKRYRVMVLAVPRQLLQSYYDLAASCGLEVAALDYMGNSLFQAMKSTCMEGTSLVAKIDEMSTMLMIIQDGSLVSLRNITYGVNEAIQTLVGFKSKEFYRQYEYGYRHAIKDLRKDVYISKNKTEMDENIVQEVTSSLEYLVSGIARVIDYYNPKSNGHPIERMYIMGLGGTFRGLDELIHDALGIPVAALSEIKGLTVANNLESFDLGEYVCCIGAAMRPLDMLLVARKDKKGEKEGTSEKGDNTGIALIVCGGGVLVAVALALAAMIPYKKAQLENEMLTAQIEQLKPVENIRNTYIETQNLWTTADNMYRLTENNNDNLVAFIQELEQKMPSDIIMLSMLAMADKVTLNIDVSSKESAAKVLQELEAFESIEVTQTNGLTDIREENNNRVVSFTVTCIYTVNPEDIVQMPDQTGQEAQAEPAAQDGQAEPVE